MNNQISDPNFNIQNRVLRVFVSSTFIDMQDERQYLIETIFPRIKKYCQERDVYFIPIDLRWGITKEQSESGQVVEVCLRSIKQSKPYFIGLLGDRYGWKPEKVELKKNPNMKRDFDFLEDDFEKRLSLTEIEMQYGVLREPELMNAAFWIRSKDTIPSVPYDNSVLDYIKLEELKAEVRLQKRYPVNDYVSIENMGDQVETFLKSVIDNLFPEKANHFEKLMVQQHSFMQQKRMLYVPRKEDYEQINAFVNSSSQFFTIAGDRGNGKSALVANWMKSRPDLSFAYCFVGSSEQSDNPLEILKLLIAQLDLSLIKEYGEKTQDKLGCDSENSQMKDNRPKDEFDVLIEKFHTAVMSWRSSNPNGKLFFIIDGINQISEYLGSKELLWVPELPDFTKAIFTTWKEDATMVSLENRGADSMEVEPLTVEQRKKIIKYFLEERNRELTQEQIDRIAEDKESASPIVLRTLLDELCYFGIYEKLDQQIEVYLSADSQEEFFDRVLGRLEISFGQNIVSRLLTGLSASRFGLSNEELLGVANSPKGDSEDNSSEKTDVLSDDDAVNPPCTLYNWEQIAFSLDNHFIVRAGLNCFSHDIIASTAQKRYQSGIYQARRQLIQYLENNGDLERKCEEIPWLLYQLEDWAGLNKFLLDFEVLIFMSESFDFRRYWLELNKKGYSLDAYFDLDALKLSPADQALSYFNLAVFGESIGKLHISERGYIKALDIIRSNPDMYKTDSLYESNYATTLNRLGNIYSSLNNFSQAEEIYLQAIDIYKRLYQIEPEKYGSDVALLLNNLGLLHMQKDLLDQSEKELFEALTIYRSFDNQSIEIKYTIAMILLNLGLLHFRKKRYSESKDAYVECLNIFKELNAKNPGVCEIDIAKTQLDMGYLFISVGNFHEAESNLTAALQVYRALVEDNPEAYIKELSMTLLNRGLLYFQTKRFSEAEKDFIEVNTLFHDLNAKYPGAFDGDIAKTQNNLGYLYNNTGRFVEAEEYLIKAFSIYSRLVEKEPDVYKKDFSMNRLNLGLLHYYTNRYSEAEDDFLETIKLYKELNQNTPNVYDGDIAKTQNNLGLVYIRAERFQDAESVLNESLECYNRLVEIHPQAYKYEISLPLMNRGLLYFNTSRYQEAEVDLLKVIDIYKDLSADYPGVYDGDIAKIQFNLGRLYLRTDRQGEGDSALHESIELYRRLVDRNPDVYNQEFIGILIIQADYYLQVERYSEAEEDLLEALSIEQDKEDIAHLRGMLGYLYYSTERYSQAEDNYNKVKNIFRQLAEDNPDDYKPAIADVLSDLARTHLKQNRDSEAKEELNEVVNICRSLDESEDSLLFVGAELHNLAHIYKEGLHDYSRCKELLLESQTAFEKLNKLHPGEFEDALNAVKDSLKFLEEEENGLSYKE